MSDENNENVTENTENTGTETETVETTETVAAAPQGKYAGLKSAQVIQGLEADQSKRRVDFRAGDTLKVSVRIKEGEKTRTQVFQGLCIAINKNGKDDCRTSFTVRKISDGIGVERIFPLQSPSVEKLEVIHKGKVRRAKLYYMRGLQGKAARLKERDSFKRA